MFVSQRLVCFLVLYVSMGVPSHAEYDWCAVYTYQHTCVNFFGTFHKQRLERGGSAVNVCGRKSSSIFRTNIFVDCGLTELNMVDLRSLGYNMIMD
jgi:hypothetical protein